MNKYLIHRPSPLGVLFRCALLSALVPAAHCLGSVALSSSDIVDGQIVFAYNAADNRVYINGSNTGVSFANSVTSAGVVLRGGSTPGWLQVPTASASTAASSYSFTWDFTAPEGYEITSLSISYRFTSLAGAVAGNTMSLALATGDGSPSTFASMTTTAASDDTGARTSDLTSSLGAGAKSFSVAGTFVFNSAEAPGSNDQMFRAEATGSAGSRFVVTMGLAPVSSIPEPSSLALIVGGLCLALCMGMRAARRKNGPRAGDRTRVMTGEC